MADLDQFVESFRRIKKEVKEPDVRSYVFHNLVVLSDMAAFMLLELTAAGLKITQCSQNIEEVTGLPVDWYYQKLLSDLDYGEPSDFDKEMALKRLEYDMITKKVELNGRKFLSIIFKESERRYAEYLIRLHGD